MTKTLFIIRHARPEPIGPGGDFSRQLTPEGVHIHRRICELIAERGYDLDRILASPLLRAQETAVVTASVLPAKIETFKALGPDFSAEILLRDLQSTDESLVAWIGHEPTLSEIAHRLVGERFLSAGLAKSGVVILEFEDFVGFGKANLVDYLHPGNSM